MRRIHSVALACVVVLAGAAAPVARADIFTWTDASGRMNISNVQPPKDAHARRIVQEAPRKPADEAMRAAARAAEMQALEDRVAELEAEANEAKQRAAALAYRPPVVAPAPVVVVTSPPAYAPPPATYAAPPDIGTCDPFTFGCPAFGYPFGVVVVNNRRFHRFDHLHANHRVHAMAAHPAPPLRRR